MRSASRQRSASCVICGLGFLTRHSQGRYCSADCRRRGAQAAWSKYARKRPESDEQRIAHNAVNAALKRGDLLRQPCERCGCAEVDAHHPDYGKPLNVVWLCRTHHREEHAKPAAMREFQSKPLGGDLFASKP